MILAFDLLTSNLVRIIACDVDNYPTDFGVSEIFRSRHTGQQFTNGPLDFATLTFNLGGNGACWRHGSWCSICIPSLKFIGLSVWKILCIYCVCVLIGLTGDLDLWGNGACQWCGSSCSICIPSLKFIGLPIRKIWRTSGLSISRPISPPILVTSQLGDIPTGRQPTGRQRLDDWATRFGQLGDKA